MRDIVNKYNTQTIYFYIARKKESLNLHVRNSYLNRFLCDQRIVDRDWSISCDLATYVESALMVLLFSVLSFFSLLPFDSLSNIYMYILYC